MIVAWYFKSRADGSPSPGLPPIISVAAPVRMVTLGHSRSVVESDSPAALTVVAFDEELKRSRAELPNRLLEPQPASSSTMPDNTATDARIRICLVLFTATLLSRFLPAIVWRTIQPRCGSQMCSIDIVLEPRI